MSRHVLLLQLKVADMQAVHQASDSIKQALGNRMADIVIGPDSMTLFTKLKPNEIRTHLQNHASDIVSGNEQKEIIEIPICYELGHDLDRVAEHCGISPDQLIQQHVASTYTCAFIGFLPGFVYADGLPTSLHCPRKSVPAKSVAAGSVGIGGAMTGIYSLQSPGGWNIIGRTPVQTFRADKMPPALLPAGQQFRFRSISLKDFESWEE